jgi:hypothetical protein
MLHASGSTSDIALADSPAVTLGTFWRPPVQRLLRMLALVVWLVHLSVAKTQCVQLKALYFVVVKNERNFDIVACGNLKFHIVRTRPGLLQIGPEIMQQ